MPFADIRAEAGYQVARRIPHSRSRLVAKHLEMSDHSGK